MTLSLTGTTATSWRPKKRLTEEEWLQIGSALAQAEGAMMWWIGDWLRHGERTWGKTYKEAAELTGFAAKTLREAVYVAGKVSTRVDKLPWKHHQLVAPLEPDRQKFVLEKAAQQGWTVRELRGYLRRERVARGPFVEDEDHSSSLEWFAEQGRRFATIYADPPWQYGNQATRAATDNHYETMPVEDICDLPVESIAADDAHLHLWTTNAFLLEAREVMESWGFTYKSCLVWVKPRLGIGNYWRVSHEFLLFGLRGNEPFGARDKRSWVECERSTHSAKPGVFRKLIEEVSPGPRIELFARQLHNGWAAWGDQIERTLFDERVS